jgi:hypothetical protein
LVAYKKHDWVEEYPGTITVCDTAGIVLELNKKSVESFRTEGGSKLLGSNLFDCHPDVARKKLKRLMKDHETNVYTVTKGKTRKIVVQAPWYMKGKYSGFVEISIRIRGKIPNVVRRS